MYSPSTYVEALLLLFIGMVCWGSWVNSHRFTRDWRFELYCWDYSFGTVLFALIFGLTLGSLFGAPTFLDNLRAADGSTCAYAAAAGAFWNVGNLLLIAAISLVGISVAFPVAIGIALILSIVLSYIIMPRGNPALLALGAGLILSAVFVNALAYRAGAAGRVPVSRSGLWMCVIAGVLIAIPGPFTARAYTAANPLSSYGVMVLFTLGALPVTFLLVPHFMRRPVRGSPISASDYFRGTGLSHLMGYVGALVWAVGSVLNFIGAQKVGVALAIAIGQANPLVAALWGIFVWKEFRGAPKRTEYLLILMFLLFILGLTVLAFAN